MNDLAPFPVDDTTLDLIEEALNTSLTLDATGEWVRVGGDFGIGRLLDFLSGHDPSKGVPLVDDDGYEVPGVIVHEDPIYCQADVIRALIAEVRRLRA